MCIIVHKLKDNPIKDRDVELMLANNPHGFGCVFIDPRKLTPVVLRWAEPTLRQIKGLIRKLNEECLESIIHFRWVTKGDQTLENTHPFQVRNDEEHVGDDIWMMHNGTLNWINATKEGPSDTRLFAEEILTPLLKGDLWYTDLFDHTIQRFLQGDWSKLAFMDGYGNVERYGNGWSKRDGNWVSNNYSFDADHRTPYVPPKRAPYTPRTGVPNVPPQRKALPPLTPVNNSGKDKETKVDTLDDYREMTLTEKQNWIEKNPISALKLIADQSAYHYLIADELFDTLDTIQREVARDELDAENYGYAIGYQHA